MANTKEDPPPVVQVPGRKLWEKLPNEPDTWYDRFDRYYRPLPEHVRTMVAAYNAYRQDTGKKGNRPVPPLWTRYGRQFGWKQRAAAWDEELRRQRRLEEQKESAVMFERHRQAAQALQNVGYAALHALAQQPEQLTPADVRMFIRDGIRLERESSGIPEEILTFQSMGDHELLARYHQLYAQVAGISGESTSGSVDGGNAHPNPEGDSRPGSGTEPAWDRPAITDSDTDEDDEAGT